MVIIVQSFYCGANTTRYVRGNVSFSVKKDTSYIMMNMARQP